MPTNDSSKHDIGILVRCLNGKIVWRRITNWNKAGGTVNLDDIQLVCPVCNSAAYAGLDQ